MPPGTGLNANWVAASVAPTPALATAAWRHKGLLVVGVLLGLGAGAASAKLQPPTYQSTAQISILKKHLGAVTDGQFPADDLAPPTEVLKSFPIVERAIRSCGPGDGGTVAPADADLAAHLQSGLAVVSVRTPVGQGNLFK